MRLPLTKRQKAKEKEKRRMNHEEEKELQEIKNSFCIAGYDVIDLVIKESQDFDNQKHA